MNTVHQTLNQGGYDINHKSARAYNFPLNSLTTTPAGLEFLIMSGNPQLYQRRLWTQRGLGKPKSDFIKKKKVLWLVGIIFTEVYFRHKKFFSKFFNKSMSFLKSIVQL